MRIPIVYIPKTRFKKFLHIERQYASKNMIIPIGCDCHPAYCLQKLHIRTQSLPFDWLNTEPILGITYVNNNIETHFSHFLKSFKTNENGHIVSEHYAYAEFIHEKNIKDSPATQDKFKKRINRFFEAYNSRQPIDFLYNFPIPSLNTSSNIELFITSVKAFTNKIKETDKLHIYLRFEENYNENKVIADKLFLQLQAIPKVNVSRYIREFNRYGGWGNSSKYPRLFEDLKITLIPKSIKIYIK